MARAAEAQPGATTLGLVQDAGAYTFSWTRVSDATYYYLWVNENGTVKLQQWFTSLEAKCAGSEPSCTVTVPLPAMQFVSGYWFVQTWSPAGYGAWSSQGTYVIRPPKPPIVADSANRYIGTLLASNWAVIDVNGAPAQLVIQPNSGFQTNSVFLYYLLASCAGQAYTFQSFPDQLQFTTGVANAYLTRGAPQSVVTVSTKTANTDGSFTACTADGNLRNIMPVNVLNLTSQLGGFTTPFKVVR
jgi:hypothetical protein